MYLTEFQAPYTELPDLWLRWTHHQDTVGGHVYGCYGDAPDGIYWAAMWPKSINKPWNDRAITLLTKRWGGRARNAIMNVAGHKRTYDLTKDN